MIGAVLLAAGLQSEAFGRGFGVAARGGVGVGARGGVAYGGSRAGVGVGPLGGVGAGGASGGTYVGPRGTTVQAGRVGGAAVGPLGGVHAGGAQGVRVTTPTGRTYSSGSAGGVSAGPLGGVRAGSVHGAAAYGPYGGAAVGSRAGVATGPFGGVAVGARGVAYGHATGYVSPAVMRSTAGYVRTGFGYGTGCFTPTWYRSHAVAWVPPRWTVGNLWAVPAWSTVSGYCGITAAPILYDYGSNVVIENNYVYVNGEQAASAEQYADQALSYADRGRQAFSTPADEFQPLGVFGLVQGDEKTAQRIFQLAINKAGIVRGNYYDAVADNTLPVYGSLDTRNQRLAWSIGDKKDVVFETGLNNLTQEQTSVLVHFGKDRTQQMILVRLEQPREGQ
jgi:hypothetical protein